MKLISSLLERYKNLRPPAEEVARRVSAALEKTMQLKIEPARIEIRRKTAHISGSSSLKSEIALHRSAVLEEVKRLGSVLDDIR